MFAQVAIIVGINFAVGAVSFAEQQGMYGINVCIARFLYTQAYGSFRFFIQETSNASQYDKISLIIFTHFQSTNEEKHCDIRLLVGLVVLV